MSPLCPMNGLNSLVLIHGGQAAAGTEAQKVLSFAFLGPPGWFGWRRTDFFLSTQGWLQKAAQYN